MLNFNYIQTLFGIKDGIITENHKVLDILPGREARRLSTYFFSFPKEEWAQVKIIVIDMWKPYLDAAKTYFKNTTVVIDRFHYIARYSGLSIRYAERSSISSPRIEDGIVKGFSGQGFIS